MLPCCEKPHPYQVGGVKEYLFHDFRLASLDKEGRFKWDIQEPGNEPYVAFTMNLKFQPGDADKHEYTCIYDEGKVYRITFVGHLQLEREVLLDDAQMKIVKDWVTRTLDRLSSYLE